MGVGRIKRGRARGSPSPLRAMIALPMPTRQRRFCSGGGPVDLSVVGVNERGGGASGHRALPEDQAGAIGFRSVVQPQCRLKYWISRSCFWAASFD